MSGFFGCASRRECVADVFYGTDYHSHLGTKRAGMAFWNGEKFVRTIHSLESAYFRNKFESDLGKYQGSKIGIGIISDTESQPITITSSIGRYSVVTVGRIDNLDEIANYLLEKKLHFSELSGSTINATEVVAVLINTAGTIEEGIRLAQDMIKGSCSMLVMTDSGIYAARDKYGRTPIIVAKDDDGYAMAFESSAFENLGYIYDRDLGAGEVAFITADGVKQIYAPGKKKQVCSFLWVYYGYPSSTYEGVNVDDSRYKCGQALAQADVADNIQADIVAGIPDSGVGHAVGYSGESGIAYKRSFVKYTPTWPRSFMPVNQNMRELVAKMKLIPNREFTKDKSVIFLDDSIVRGTQLRDNVCKLTELGVKEVHMRIACPPLVYPCQFINFSTSRSSFDLFTRRIIRDLEGTENLTDEMLNKYSNQDEENYKIMVEEMRKRLGLTTLKFQRLEDLVSSIGLNKEDLCTHCFDNSSYM